MAIKTLIKCAEMLQRVLISKISKKVGFIDRSIRQEQLDEINSVLERDFMIRAIHDVKGIDMGSNLIRYKVKFLFNAFPFIEYN